MPSPGSEIGPPGRLPRVADPKVLISGTRADCLVAGFAAYDPGCTFTLTIQVHADAAPSDISFGLFTPTDAQTGHVDLVVITARPGDRLIYTPTGDQRLQLLTGTGTPTVSTTQWWVSRWTPAHELTIEVTCLDLGIEGKGTVTAEQMRRLST